MPHSCIATHRGTNAESEAPRPRDEVGHQEQGPDPNPSYVVMKEPAEHL